MTTRNSCQKDQPGLITQCVQFALDRAELDKISPERSGMVLQGTILCHIQYDRALFLCRIPFSSSSSGTFRFHWTWAESWEWPGQLFRSKSGSHTSGQCGTHSNFCHWENIMIPGIFFIIITVLDLNCIEFCKLCSLNKVSILHPVTFGGRCWWQSNAHSSDIVNSHQDVHN